MVLILYMYKTAVVLLYFKCFTCLGFFFFTLRNANHLNGVSFRLLRHTCTLFAVQDYIMFSLYSVKFQLILYHCKDGNWSFFSSEIAQV